MNPFQRARQEALATREKLVPGRVEDVIHAKKLLACVESALELAVEPVDPSYPDLGGGSAVLERVQQFIYVSKGIPPWGDKFCGLVAHEIGHWFLDATRPPLTVAHLKTLFGSDGSPATLKVEAYGARERQELQANVFAKELLLPRALARRLALGGSGPSKIAADLGLALGGSGPSKIAADLGIPIEFVRQQMLDALLLPNTEPSTGQLHAPSPDQLAAARAKERAANVVAGPGTGKTSTLIHRVKYLIEVERVDPGAILVLTFTNKAAFELVERLTSAGIDRAADVWAGTFHSFGLEFLRKFHQHFNLESELRVADRMTTMTTLVAGLPRLDLRYYLRVEDPYDWLNPVVDGIKRLKEELVSASEYRAFVVANPVADPELQLRRGDVASLYEAHEALLAGNKTVDFVDLIAKPALALRANRAPFAEFTDGFQHILVDEYQDVTQAMVEFLRQLTVKSKSIWVVGDVRQAIHHWRGASLKSLLKFDSEFKAHAGGSKIQRYPLDVNRRSAQEILDLVEEVGRRHTLQAQMPLDKMTASRGHCGELPTVVTCARRDQVLAAIVEGVQTLQQKGTTFGSQAVLCRSGEDVRHAAEAFASQGVPVIYIGELAQRPEVKRLLCLMQLLVERQPRALMGLVDVPGLAMPLADIRLMLKASEDDVGFQRGRWLETPPPDLSSTALNVVAQLNLLLDGYRHSSNPWVFVCDMLLEHRFGLPVSGNNSVAAWVQRIALWQFAYAVRNGDGEMKEARLSRFLMRQRLRQRIGEAYVDRELPPEAAALNGVRLLTVHASKGLEFDAVHVGYVNAGTYGGDAPTWTPPDSILDIVPPEALRSSQDEYEKEAAVERNNLLYVAVSRARRTLRIYQETQFGEDNIAPQLRHRPQKFQAERYNGPSSMRAAAPTRRSFRPASVVNFEHFDAYVMCALQYWYAQVIGLKSEADIDVSVRARLAVMRALKAVAANPTATPAAELLTSWIEGRLPAEAEDPSLWRDANFALSKGLQLIEDFISEGGQLAEPTSVIGGVTVQMPWGFLINSQYGAEFAMVRFSRRRVSDLSTVLKPLVNGLNLSGQRSLTLNHVLSEKVDAVAAARRIESTKSYMASQRMLAGNNEPIKGRHCGRCAFMTICPSSPLQ